MEILLGIVGVVRILFDILGLFAAFVIYQLATSGIDLGGLF
jgi:hypothetical protein